MNDDDIRRYTFSHVLTREGFRVTEARTGAEAIEKAMAQPDLMLLDIRLPDMSGFDVCRRIKQDERTARIAVLQTSAVEVSSDRRVAGLDGGADGFLVQPFEHDELIAMVRSLLRARDAEQQRGDERVRVSQAETDEARRHAAILEKTAQLLAVSLDYQQTLAHLAQLAVPEFADYCVVDVVDAAGALDAVVVAHRDPDAEERLREARLRYPPRLDASFGVGKVLRTGQPELDMDLGEGWQEAIARGAQQLEDLRRLGVRSYMTVPLGARGRTLGAISFARLEGERYGQAELRLAQDVAGRAALALDNARLFADNVALRSLAERTLDEAQRERQRAEEAIRFRDEFLATLSHELRTPLNAVLGWASLLRGGGVNEAMRERALATIERNVRLQTRLVDDILDLSRVITGKLRLDVRELPLGEAVHSAIESLRPAADAKQIRVEIGPFPAQLAVLADPNRLQQIVWNLVGNAVKFTPTGGRVRVQLARAGEHAQISVEDNGPGIEPEFLPHVFERFRQADGSSTRRHGGLGLGLAIVRHLVELHGGTVEAHSDGLGKGARFTVRMPLSREALVEPGRRAGGQLDSDAALLDRVRILVVDDQEDTREVLQTALERKGALVTVASSVDEAMRSIEAQHPDIILSDIGLPDEDGYSFLRRLRASGEEGGAFIPAIALTAYAGASDRGEAMLAGFQMHVAKPADPADLVVHIRRLLRRSG